MDAREDRKRKRTVKMPATVMRTAGVEDAAQTLPKPRSEVFAKKRCASVSLLLTCFSKLENNLKLGPEVSIESIHQKITVSPTEPKKSMLLVC